MRGSPRCRAPEPTSCRRWRSSPRVRGSSSRSCTSSPAGSTKCSAPSPPEPEVNMHNVGIILRRELASYFATPLAYIFILIFLVLANAFAFYLGGFYERGQADLDPFFAFHPWLYLFLIPAVSMKLWAEERKSGSIELLMTQPVTLLEAVLGKFFAAWIFTALALALTFPLWITVNYLGRPDNGAILAAYLACLMLACALLAIGSFLSGATRSPVVALILGVEVSFVFLLGRLPLVLDAVRA